MKPLVSVLVPMHNEEHGVRRTLQSLMHQTFCDFEIIIVDDGSTDNSAEIVEDEFPTVRIIHQENKGIAHALNLGLKYCAGAFVARIDCNDEAYPYRFEKQVNAMFEDSSLGIVGGHVMLYEKDDTNIGICKYPITPENTVRELLRGNPSILHETALIRKSILDQLGGYDPFYNGREDFELWSRISLVAKMTNIDELVTRSLSTAEGISFRGIKLSPLIDLALIERKERIIKGVEWKNHGLREKYTKRLEIAKKNELTDDQIMMNKITLYNRRASFLLRSGDREGGIREYLRAVREKRFNIKSFLGLFGAYFLPISLFKFIYNVYRWGNSLLFDIKARKNLNE